MGKFKPHKGFDILLRAYARLHNPPVDLLMAGHGRQQPELMALAQQLGIGDRVRFVGFVTGQEKINLYRSATVFVCPRAENHSPTLFWSAGAGLPVVAADVGGNPELVHHDKHGLLFPAEDDQALAALLRCLVDTSALLTRLRANVPGFVQQFDWPSVTQRYLALYRTCLRPT